MLYIFSPEEELLALLSPDFTHSSSSGGAIKQTFLSEAFPAEFDSEVFDGCLYWGAIPKEVLNGENIFQFTIPSKQIQTAYVQEGNLITKDVPHQLVEKVREYFNLNNVVYDSFSYDDLIPYLS